MYTAIIVLSCLLLLSGFYIKVLLKRSTSLEMSVDLSKGNETVLKDRILKTESVILRDEEETRYAEDNNIPSAAAILDRLRKRHQRKSAKRL